MKFQFQFQCDTIFWYFFAILFLGLQGKHFIYFQIAKKNKTKTREMRMQLVKCKSQEKKQKKIKKSKNTHDSV